jgi:hypothetical protein
MSRNGYDPSIVAGLARAARTLATAGDGLNLDLPPIGGAGTGLGAAAINALSTLYFYAELEQAGIITAAELLVEARGGLNIQSVRAAEKLEQFAQRERDWYDRHSREVLFARLFGVGAAATVDADGGVNHAFEQLMAVLCAAIDRAATELGPTAPPSVQAEVQVRTAATNLLSNLEPRQFGNTVFAARRIQDELTVATQLLSDPDVDSIFHTNGFWATVRRILEPDVPDFHRFVDMGQSGQHLLGWLASVLGALGDVSQQLLPATSPLYAWASTWLAASGIDMSPGSQRRAA